MIVLSDKIQVTEKYSGKSKFEFWHKIELKDILVISMKLKPTGSNRGKIYAPSIGIKNMTNGLYFVDSINSIQKYLTKISWEEIYE